MPSGKIGIKQTLTATLFTIMENTSLVFQGLTIMTESLVLPKNVSSYLPINFDTISRATLLFENLRFLVSAWDTFVHCTVMSVTDISVCLSVDKLKISDRHYTAILLFFMVTQGCPGQFENQ